MSKSVDQVVELYGSCSCGAAWERAAVRGDRRQRGMLHHVLWDFHNSTVCCQQLAVEDGCDGLCMCLLLLLHATAVDLAAPGAVTEAVATLLTRGQAAVEDILRAPSAASNAAADAFQQLQVIRELLELASSKQHDRVLQVSSAGTCAEWVGGWEVCVQSRGLGDLAGCRQCD